MGLRDLEKMKVRQDYRNLWHKDLMSTMTFDPAYCCFALFCPYCASYKLRKRAIYNDMSRYICCGGYMPCSGKCGEKHCPAFCLCCEVLCCFAPSVSSTRYLIQDEFNIKTTPCDNCIIGCMVCLKQISCICSLLACLTGSSELGDIAECLGCISDTVYCSVCACMQTQHKIELDKRDGKYAPQPVMAAPPTQQMSRADHSIPSPGYPPQGSPPMGYHQPPPMGYPHQPPGYMHPPAYGQPMNGSSKGGHDPYPPVPYHPQHPPYLPHMYHPHAAYFPGPAPGAYPAGPPPGLYPQGPDSGFVPGPESGPYPPARPPPPPPGYHAEPSAPLPPHEEHPETAPTSSNPPK
ncbi:pollen-specific leucine-rich repeat extensin-like protein 3 [Rosa rugosa]|uniref:pollen-specific leucine-rich repeat extensin-like protein 3 n=1 Tax=Rosa rugosa TaxID=74645 RepID=UPI002B40F610|nr:pollen-specific leucine-rich repeat extensin-like protein 3 [Rosa rugosa]